QIGLRKISLFFGGLFVLLILVLGSLQIAGIISFSKGKNPEVRSAQTSVTRPKGSPIMTPSLTPTPVLTPVPTPRPIIKPTPTPVVLPPTVTFGYSAKGRPITGYIFGSGGEGILIFGAIHGNERGT
ncbi:MAG: hypothetical protein GTN40_04645, partial [Candidatus Aenigmarchaeota archaeon]|nr:hypothetical protein [Candidatus Aenigmarchaeota archaeon]